VSLGDQDELLHGWDDDPAWQESVAVWFFDPSSAAGGFFRFGVHPVAGYGRYNLFAFREGEQRFRRVDERAPLPELAPGGDLAVAGCRAGLTDGGAVRFSWDEPECSADLVFDGFYPRQGFEGRAADDAHLQRDVYAGHLECSGRLAGTVRLGDDEHRVDALCHRDRSWGPRRIDGIHTNRMFTGTMGPELSFAMNVIQTADGRVNKVGYIVRDGRVEQLADFEILPSIHLDGYSVASGTCRARLTDGEELHFEAVTIAGQLTPWDDYLCSEHISRARCGELTGFCDNELTNNPREGTAQPRFLMYVDGGDGLSPFAAPETAALPTVTEAARAREGDEGQVS
jgi:hypothetical protein